MPCAFGLLPMLRAWAAWRFGCRHPVHPQHLTLLKLLVPTLNCSGAHPVHIASALAADCQRAAAGLGGAAGLAGVRTVNGRGPSICARVQMRQQALCAWAAWGGGGLTSPVAPAGVHCGPDSGCRKQREQQAGAINLRQHSPVALL